MANEVKLRKVAVDSRQTCALWLDAPTSLHYPAAKLGKSIEYADKVAATATHTLARRDA